jgi:hypothetical protein
MVLGIVGITGFAFCLTFLAAPFAWYFGAKAVREIDANPGRYDGRSEANAGKIMGIIGTILLILAVVAVIVFVAIGIAGGWDDESRYDYDLILGAF